MATDRACISVDETILRRVPPNREGSPAQLIERHGTLTATSIAIRPRRGEAAPSWSRRRITSPPELLEILASAGTDITGWSVVELKVAEVRSLGLDVSADPTVDDKGHCVIVPTLQQPFTDTIWSALAKRTRVVWPKP